MTSRPVVTIIGADGKGSNKTHPLPNVFRAPIRPDIVQYARYQIPIHFTMADEDIGVFTLAWQRTSVNHMP
jgi:large subunit ribosomal protein L4e